MNSQFRKNGLMVALSAGVFAVSSFAAMNAYAHEIGEEHVHNACLVCWSPDSTLCDIIADGTGGNAILMDHEPTEVMWMSCYEEYFRASFDDGTVVTNGRCLNAPGNYSTAIPHPPVGFPNPNVADASWWFAGKTCRDVVRENEWVPGYVPRAADSLEYTPICLVRNDGLNNETVSGIGILAPGATGLLPGACPAN